MPKCTYMHIYASTHHHSSSSDHSLLSVSPFMALATFVTSDSMASEMLASVGARLKAHTRGCWPQVTWTSSQGCSCHSSPLPIEQGIWQRGQPRCTLLSLLLEANLGRSVSSPVPNSIRSTHQAWYRVGEDHAELERREGRQSLGAVLETGFHRLVVLLVTMSLEY